ncbi:MAG TPA: hypothetical protein PLG91_11200, partial [Ferruginibacter sp.]|nr:hypothetical protein [Ferruginibacter sp.]
MRFFANAQSARKGSMANHSQDNKVVTGDGSGVKRKNRRQGQPVISTKTVCLFSSGVCVDQWISLIHWRAKALAGSTAS